MAEQQVIVHMIGQAHLDPVWLWQWTSGLDEVLATCRTACDLLDAYPDFVFTRAEAWSYQQVEKLDPILFKRIRKHMEAGRWEIAGGWWLQPDCNFPSGVGLERQIAIGKSYLLDRFGLFPEVGYNVDSFGHTATLPAIMRGFGQRYYVFMRPQEHERALPGRLFRWRGYEDSPEVIAFRIAGQYCTGGQALDERHIRNAMSELPEGISHTMCFYGVGDHGGGPTAQLIEWVRDHREAFPGARLEFSSPSRFFAAIADEAERLPVVTGELQMHAIGCYTVQRGIKTRVQRAEHQLRQAELMLKSMLAPDAALEKRLEEAWQRVCFAQFHDILGGTCVPSAYQAVYDRLGASSALADDMLQYGLRVKMAMLPDDERQRMVFYNASDCTVDDYTEVEPWLGWRAWQPTDRIIDEEGRTVPHQVMQAEWVGGQRHRVLLRARLAPGEMKVLRITTDSDEEPAPSLPAVEGRIANDLGLAVNLPGGQMQLPGVALTLPQLALIEDRSDNWSHNLDRFPEGPVTSAIWDDPCVLAQGPLLAALLQTGRIGDSPLRAEWRVYAERPYIELRLEVHWSERLKLLKLVLPLPGMPDRRTDGIPGGHLGRANDGRELPVRDWTLCEVPGGPRVGIACPDVYALDGLPRRLRFTLLRAAIMTHHIPDLGTALNGKISDQGMHSFRFRFYGGEGATFGRLEDDATAMHRPLVYADLTRGMPRR